MQNKVRLKLRYPCLEKNGKGTYQPGNQMVAQNERLKAKRKEYISNDVDLPLEFFQLPELGEVVPPEPETKVA